MNLDQGRADELAALLAVARGGSFVAAAAALGRHPTVISRRIGTLEQRLGVRLIERTTRRVRLTETGERLAERLQIAADAIFEAEQEAAAGGVELKGRLRLAFPAAMGRQWLAPALPDFARQYPGLEIEVDYAERYVDLVGEGFDAALRVGILSDNRLVARKLGEHRIVLGASPDYLQRHGVPASPAALLGHNLLRYTGPVSTHEWRMRKDNLRETIMPAGTYRSNDISALLEAARRGIGIVGFGDWAMVSDFAAGTLVQVLPEWRFDADEGIYLVRPSRQFTPARTEAFIQWIAALFADGLPWDSRATRLPGNRDSESSGHLRPLQ
ncbi:LysR family transcriptional regulator [Burkholderia multivorans]|uniref:LysR family transcriptional regulator n=1 Tax=Burkholderia multivorans TaxID=87883 RepID=UPI000CFF6BE0|nr:LysR family transcriptional regulator [Burkholderia multivorans]PRG77673.1 LysR family transcriptional regulator [Burkholderia multivorans]